MNEDKRNYRLDEIQARVINGEDSSTPTTYIVFSTLLETRYYSPGIKLRRNKENNIHIEFIRTGIRDKAPEVDVKAEYLSKWVKDTPIPIELKDRLVNKSTPAEQIIVLQGEIDSISVTDGNSEKIIWKKSHPGS